MAERRSAISHLPGRSVQAGRATLAEVRTGSILQIAAWPGTQSAAVAAIGDLLGVNAPAVGSATFDAQCTIAAVAPGRYLITAAEPDLSARFEAALPSADAAVTELSHARVILRLQGEGAAEMLQACVAIDLGAAAFPAGRVAQTMIHHIDVVVYRRAADSFDLWVIRSFAEALAEWLLDTGLELQLTFISR